MYRGMSERRLRFPAAPARRMSADQLWISNHIEQTRTGAYPGDRGEESSSWKRRTS